MEFKVEQMSDKNMYRLIVEATAEEFEQGVDRAYEKNKKRLSIPGFRKGRAPRAVIEKMYGKEIFHNDACDEIVPELYEKAAAESGLDIVSKPALKVVQMDQEKPLVFTAEVAVKPEVVLGDYKGIEIDKKDAKVTAAEVKEELEKIQNTHARVVEVTDRPVKDKDITTIDFEGSIDGVPFEGGKGTGYPLTIGSHSFIDTFEDQMIGMKVGEERDVKVTFPAEYHAEALKGKEAVFKVIVKEIKERQLPKLDDEFAQDVSEFDTLAEYKDSIKAKLKENKERAVQNEKERALISIAAENATIEVPAPMIEAEVTKMLEDLAKNLQAQNMKIDDYFRYMNITADKFREDAKPEAEKRIKERLVLEAVGKAEKLDPSDKQLKDEMKKIADMYQMDLEDFEVAIGEEGKKSLINDCVIKNALDFIVKEAKEKKPAAKKTTAKKADEAEEEKAEKKPAAKKTTTKKADDKAPAKKTTAKKTTTKKADNE